MYAVHAFTPTDTDLGEPLGPSYEPKSDPQLWSLLLRRRTLACRAHPRPIRIMGEPAGFGSELQTRCHSKALRPGCELPNGFSDL